MQRCGEVPSPCSGTSLPTWLLYEAHKDLLAEGLLSAMHELRLQMHCSDHHELEEQLEALGMVRQLPALTKLELELCDHEEDEDDDVDDDDDNPVEWPPFIPPSLKALSVKLFWLHHRAIVEPFLHALPGMLGASGARLERLEIQPHYDFTRMGDGLSSVAQALRCCSPTLKDFSLLSDYNTFIIDGEAEDHAEQEARLRVQWAEVLAGVSACRELQVLKLQLGIQVEPLFPPGTAFAHLTDLDICDHEREHPPPAGEMGVWELMASGGLPALAKLSASIRNRRAGVEAVKTRVAPALEVVAGTLTQLDLWSPAGGSDGDHYELGVAVGKLRRLKDLTLMLSKDGKAYHAFAQGLTASGGDSPLPMLWRVDVSTTISSNADLLASLLLPSVRVFRTCHRDARAALLVACTLRQAGYKHIWALMVFDREDSRDLVQGVAQCSLGQYY
jgi:hypothetical protein